VRLLVLALVAGCYDPAVDDCQFRCSTQMDCPDGTQCMGQFCRADGATGMCMLPDPCPAIAPPASCTNGMKFPLDGGGCGIVCQGNKIEFRDLGTSCTGVWKPGRLDAVSELDIAPVSDRTWLGAARASNTFAWSGYGVDITEPVWDAGFPQTDGGSEDCAYIDMPKRRLRNDRQCDTAQSYICTTP
jgi:hypothetical protein